ncbi:ArgK/MeaB family GTPase [Ketobacter sp.]|uniref:ArgK/MeaB family GTPase n=1 Tax=Ketobacter sp. TaxID=2083498 RepID=UPI000F199765|nr:GTP-binding protein [Ketobacter sp.]RLT98606.1 MAG: protein kinase [Ketobacter sp.]
MQPDLDPAWIEKLNQARALKKWPLAKLITLFESKLPGSAHIRQAIHHHILNHPDQFPRKACILGFTGTPGAGKSSLIAELCRQLLAKNPNITVAVLAIDPSSQISGGSILGDRTRMHYGKKEPRLFFRSQASNLELGGITESTFQACRVLRHLFDYIIIETVGIGQNEIDIQYMTDHTFLVMQPLAGDQIQFMKCGIMEIPDSFIVNKCDEERLARTSYHMLRSSLKQAKLVELHAEDDYRQAAKDKIFLTSALKGKGIQELADHALAQHSIRPWHQAELFYLKKSIQRRYGEFGIQFFEQAALQPLWENEQISYEEKERGILSRIQEHIRQDLFR